MCRSLRQMRLIVSDRGYFIFLAFLPFIMGALSLSVPGNVGFGVPVPAIQGGEAEVAAHPCGARPPCRMFRRRTGRRCRPAASTPCVDPHPGPSPAGATSGPRTPLGVWCCAAAGSLWAEP